MHLSEQPATLSFTLQTSRSTNKPPGMLFSQQFETTTHPFLNTRECVCQARPSNPAWSQPLPGACAVSRPSLTSDRPQPVHIGSLQHLWVCDDPAWEDAFKGCQVFRRHHREGQSCHGVALLGQYHLRRIRGCGGAAPADQGAGAQGPPRAEQAGHSGHPCPCPVLHRSSPSAHRLPPGEPHQLPGHHMGPHRSCPKKQAVGPADPETTTQAQLQSRN